MENGKFNISGIPENNEFEISESKKSNGKLPSMSFDMQSFKHFLNETAQSKEELAEIEKMLPKEILDQMAALGLDMGGVINQIGAMFSNCTPDIMNEFMQSLENGDDFNYNDSIDSPKQNPFPSANPSLILQEEFGSLAAIQSASLYDDFVEKFGTDSTKYLDDNIGIRNFYLNKLTATLNLDSIKNMKFINSNQYFILFYMEPVESENYGYYSAVFRQPDGEFAMYIPSYCNTFNISENNDKLYLYNFEKNKDKFYEDVSDLTSFKYLSVNLIMFAISFVLSPVKNVLLAPHYFGNIKNTRQSITSDSDMLQIGKISSNGSVEATLLLKDAELPLDKDSYPLYIKFPHKMDTAILNLLADVLFNVDFNESEIMKNVELRYTNRGELYIEINHFE